MAEPKLSPARAVGDHQQHSRAERRCRAQYAIKWLRQGDLEMPHNPSGERVFTLGPAGLKRPPQGLTSWRRGLWVRVASPFLSLHFSSPPSSSPSLPTSLSSPLATVFSAVCASWGEGGWCRCFVSRQHVLSSVPGNLSHRVPLILIKTSFFLHLVPEHKATEG